jgi:hypothetical protein
MVNAYLTEVTILSELPGGESEQSLDTGNGARDTESYWLLVRGIAVTWPLSSGCVRQPYFASSLCSLYHRAISPRLEAEVCGKHRTIPFRACQVSRAYRGGPHRDPGHALRPVVAKIVPCMFRVMVPAVEGRAWDDVAGLTFSAGRSAVPRVDAVDASRDSRTENCWVAPVRSRSLLRFHLPSCETCPEFV